jgi:alpha-beta hydrolase superfamily lysophospholipase
MAAMICGLLLISCDKKEEPVVQKTEATTEEVRKETKATPAKAIPESFQQRKSLASRPDCLLLDRPDALKVIFYPRRDRHPERTDEFDVFIPVAEDVRLGGRLHVAQQDSPVILLFHGNGEIASDYDYESGFYKQIGVSILVVDYRGYGKSDGTPTASALLDDATVTYQQARGILSDRGLNDSRLFIMGRSLGSAAALEAASHAGDAIDGMIIESGFASALPFIQGPLSDDMKQGVAGFDNASKIKRLSIPALIIHGQADQLIPVRNAKLLYDNCGAEQKSLVVIPNAGHNDLIPRGKDLYFSAIRDFIFG